MRLIGWIFLLAGIWSVWSALADEEPLGAGGVLLVVIGTVLLSARARALVTWVGEGVVTGLCIMGGLGLLGIGVLMLVAYGEMLAGGVFLPVRSVVLPLVFLGCGLMLLIVGLRRLWRLRGLP